MRDPKPRSAEWWNQRIQNAVARAFPAVEAAIGAYAPDGFPMGYAELTWKTLQDMEPEAAIQTVAQMMLNPQTQAAGMKFARRILERAPQEASYV